MKTDLTKIHSIKDLAKHYDALLFDIWGVIIKEEQTHYPGVIDSINHLINTKAVYFISNTPFPAEKTIERLTKMGISLKPNTIFTSGSLTRKLLSNNNYINSIIKRPLDNNTAVTIYHLGEDTNQYILADLHIHLTDDIEKADLIIISRGSDSEYHTNNIIHKIFQAASKRKLPAICPNPDMGFFNSKKNSYCAGYFSNIYAKLGGEVNYIGKPHSNIFEFLFDSTGLKPQQDKILLVGDTLATDILGARKAKIDSALVTTGNIEIILKKDDDEITKLNKIDKFCEEHLIWPNYVVSLK